jgi:hypothetical protein
MIGFACNGVGPIRQPYIREPLAERRTALREHFVAVEDVFQWAKAWDADNVDKIQEFLDESIKGRALRRGASHAWSFGLPLTIALLTMFFICLRTFC